MLLSANSQPVEKISGERIWKKNGFFSDERADFNFDKKNFPESTLCYINQAYLATVKGGELAIYNHNFILGQLVVAANQPENTDEYNYKKNEVRLIACLNDKSTDELLGLNLQLACIILRGDMDESFFSYGYNDEKSKVLNSAAKDRIPNPIISTCFKKHFHEIMNERRHNEESSGLFSTYHRLRIAKKKLTNIAKM